MDTNWDVIVIGAGMAGLSAAQHLQQAGKRVLVIDKSRGIGGRMATRRQADAQWDHGAQYFTARSADFRRQVATWLASKHLARWTAPIYTWDGSTLQASSPQQRFVGTPTMNAPLHAMAAQLSVKLSMTVTALTPTVGGWEVCSDTHSWQATQVVLALPAPQAAALLPSADPSQAQIAQIPMQPCWALLFSMSAAPQLPFGGVFINEGALSWLAVDSSKPGRAGLHWVAHASAEWSQAHLSASAAEIAAQLEQELIRLFHQWGQAAPSISHSAAHRWLYARGQCDQSPAPAVHQGLALAGDWLMGGRVEGAYLSGQAAAQALLTHTPANL